MAKLEWGKKRKCQGCGLKYYDLNKISAECPNCGVVFQLVQPQRGRRSKVVAKAPKSLKDAYAPADGRELENKNIQDNTSEPGDDVLPEDTSDLVGNSDDISKVVDVAETDRNDI